MPRAMALSLLAALLLPAAGAWSCAQAEVPGSAVCSERERCDGEQVCVLGRCRKKATMPMSTDAPQLTFTPLDFAWVDGAGVRGPNDIGGSFVFGKAGDDAVLYLRFAVEIPAKGRLQRAVLMLDPLPRCARRPGRVAFEVAQVLSPWKSSQVTVGDRPALGLPMKLADMSVTPPVSLRLDVTELVSEWQRHDERYYGVALSGAGDSDSGACFTSGLEHGRGPRLYIYLWPDADAGADKEEEDGGAGGGGGDAS